MLDKETAEQIFEKLKFVFESWQADGAAGQLWRGASSAVLVSGSQDSVDVEEHSMTSQLMSWLLDALCPDLLLLLAVSDTGDRSLTVHASSGKLKSLRSIVEGAPEWLSACALERNKVDNLSNFQTLLGRCGEKLAVLSDAARETGDFAGGWRTAVQWCGELATVTSDGGWKAARRAYEESTGGDAAAAPENAAAAVTAAAADDDDDGDVVITKVVAASPSKSPARAPAAASSVKKAASPSKAATDASNKKPAKKRAPRKPPSCPFVAKCAGHEVTVLELGTLVGGERADNWKGVPAGYRSRVTVPADGKPLAKKPRKKKKEGDEAAAAEPEPPVEEVPPVGELYTMECRVLDLNGPAPEFSVQRVQKVVGEDGAERWEADGQPAQATTTTGAWKIMFGRLTGKVCKSAAGNALFGLSSAVVKRAIGYDPNAAGTAAAPADDAAVTPSPAPAAAAAVVVASGAASAPSNSATPSTPKKRARTPKVETPETRRKREELEAKRAVKRRKKEEAARQQEVKERQAKKQSNFLLGFLKGEKTNVSPAKVIVVSDVAAPRATGSAKQALFQPKPYFIGANVKMAPPVVDAAAAEAKSSAVDRLLALPPDAPERAAAPEKLLGELRQLKRAPFVSERVRLLRNGGASGGDSQPRALPSTLRKRAEVIVDDAMAECTLTGEKRERRRQRLLKRATEDIDWLSVGPIKLLSFGAESARPPYRGSHRRRSHVVGARRPLAKDLTWNDYRYDSGDEWNADDENGEELFSDDEDDEEDDDADDEDEDKFVVADGYLSEDEGVKDARGAEVTVETSVRRNAAGGTAVWYGVPGAAAAAAAAEAPTVDEAAGEVPVIVRPHAPPPELALRLLQPAPVSFEAPTESEVVTTSRKLQREQAHARLAPALLRQVHGSRVPKSTIVAKFLEEMKSGTRNEDGVLVEAPPATPPLAQESQPSQPSQEMAVDGDGEAAADEAPGAASLVTLAGLARILDVHTKKESTKVPGLRRRLLVTDDARKVFSLDDLAAEPADDEAERVLAGGEPKRKRSVDASVWVPAWCAVLHGSHKTKAELIDDMVACTDGKCPRAEAERNLRELGARGATRALRGRPKRYLVHEHVLIAHGQQALPWLRPEYKEEFEAQKLEEATKAAKAAAKRKRKAAAGGTGTGKRRVSTRLTKAQTAPSDDKAREEAAPAKVPPSTPNSWVQAEKEKLPSDAMSNLEADKLLREQYATMASSGVDTQRDMMETQS